MASPSPDLVSVVHRQLITHLVSRAITCPRTGEVLDVRTCVVLLDADGDPAHVLSQQGWAEVCREGGEQKLANIGLTVDPSTLRS
jgi:hypothetical protein